MTMRKFVAGVAFGILILGLGVRISRGQQSSTVQMAHKEIKQGDILNLDVTVDKAPNLTGTIQVIATSDGGGDFGMTCHLDPGQTKCGVGQNVPLDAKLGKWTIRQVAFIPSAGGPMKDLTKQGDLSFQIIAHGDVILPDGATISDIR
jgi:hypothetical protein